MSETPKQKLLKKLYQAAFDFYELGGVLLWEDYGKMEEYEVEIMKEAKRAHRRAELLESEMIKRASSVDLEAAIEMTSGNFKKLRQARLRQLVKACADKMRAG